MKPQELAWSKTRPQVYNCLMCGTQFEAKRKAKYCSSSCGDKFWRQNNPERWQELRQKARRSAIAKNANYYRDNYRKHREKRLSYSKRMYYAKGLQRLRKTGHGLEYFRDQIRLQNGRCPICKEILNGSSHADHNHLNNKPRGVLCKKCNIALGLFQDSQERLYRSLAYLEKWRHE